MKGMLIVFLTLACALLSSAETRSFSAKQKFFRDPHSVKPKQSGGAVVVNAASFLPGVSPGGLATVVGPNLSDVSGAVAASTNPFPFELANVSVTVNDVPAAIFSVAYANGQDQISFQVPWETPVGPQTADVQVFDYGNLVGEEVVDSYTEDPGIFGYQRDGNTYAVATHASDYTLVTPDHPAQRGEYIVVYTTGLGPIDLHVPNGLGAPSDPLANTIDPFRITVADEDAHLYFSGLAPGFVGLYQLNIRLPDELPAGDLPMRILSDYANSQTVQLTVE